jgi:hypothetical protein
VIDGPLFFWHAPPGEVHLFPGSAVGNSLTESIVSFTSVESLLYVFSVLEVSNGSSEDACEDCTIAKKGSLFSGQSFDQTFCKHFYY